MTERNVGESSKHEEIEDEIERRQNRGASLRKGRAQAVFGLAPQNPQPFLGRFSFNSLPHLGCAFSYPLTLQRGLPNSPFPCPELVALPARPPSACTRPPGAITAAP